MADLGNQKIKNTYQLVLQTDAGGNLQKLDGSTPNPFIINQNLRYLDGTTHPSGYVLVSDGSGNASWGAVAFSGDVYISGGSIDGTVIELQTTSGNTISIPGLAWSANTDGSVSPSGGTTDVIVNGDITTKGTLNLAGTNAYIAKGGTNRLALSTASQSILYGNWKILNSSYFAFDTQSYFRAFRDSNTNRNTLQGTTGGLDLSCSTSNTMNLYSSTIGLGKPSSTVNVNDDLFVIDNTTIGGDLTVNTSTLYVDSTNDRVGVGTLNPDAYLTVSGDSAGFTSYNMNGGSAEFQNNNTRVKFSNGANTNDLSPGDRIQVTTNGVTYIVIVSTVDNSTNISLTVNFPGQTEDQVQEFNYDDGTNDTLFKVYDTTTPVFQVSGSTVMSGSTDLLSIFASSAITNQDVYWSANTNGSITNSGNTDITTTGNGNFANLQVPATGKLRFDDVTGSDDQYITGNENNITIDGDDKVKLIANNTIEVGIATNDIKLKIDTSEGHITASGNLGISGNTFFGGTLSGTGAVTTLSQIVASSYNSTTATSGYNLNGTKYLWKQGDYLQVGNTTGTVPNTDIIGKSINLQTATTINGNLTVTGNTNIGGTIVSDNEQYWSTTGRLTVGNNTTNYYGPNPQGTNYYFWNRDLGTSSTVITSKTATLNSGFKLPYKAVLTGYHLNIQGRSTNDNISFTLVYCDGMWDGDVTSTSQTLVEAEGAQTITIASANNFYVLDRRDQLSISVDAMTMLYPRFKKTSTAAGTTGYDFQLAIQYRIVN